MLSPAKPGPDASREEVARFKRDAKDKKKNPKNWGFQRGAPPPASPAAPATGGKLESDNSKLAREKAEADLKLVNAQLEKSEAEAKAEKELREEADAKAKGEKALCEKAEAFAKFAIAVARMIRSGADLGADGKPDVAEIERITGNSITAEARDHLWELITTTGPII